MTSLVHPLFVIPISNAGGMDDDYDLSAPENAILLLCLQYEQLVELLGLSLPPRGTVKKIARAKITQ